jgi:hypothetical protein
MNRSKDGYHVIVVIDGNTSVLHSMSGLNCRKIRDIKAFSGRTHPRRSDVVEFLLKDPGLRRACSKHSAKWPRLSRQQQAPVTLKKLSLDYRQETKPKVGNRNTSVCPQSFRLCCQTARTHARED